MFYFHEKQKRWKQKRRQHKKETFRSFRLRFRRAYAYVNLFSRWCKHSYASACASIVYPLVKAKLLLYKVRKSADSDGPLDLVKKITAFLSFFQIFLSRVESKTQN